MSKLRLLTLIGLCAALIPTLAAAGEPTGSCYANFIDRPESNIPLFPEGKGNIAYCADDVTEADCDAFSGGGADWQEGGACLDIDTPFGEWDGTCLLGDVRPFEQVCLLLWIDPQEGVTSQEVCEGKGQGRWFDDPGCGFPVPAAPKVALAAMALLLLAIPLAMLSVKGVELLRRKALPGFSLLADCLARALPPYIHDCTHGAPGGRWGG